MKALTPISVLVLVACAPPVYKIPPVVKKAEIEEFTAPPPTSAPTQVVVSTSVASTTVDQCDSGGYVLSTYVNAVLTSSSVVCNDFTETPIGPLIAGKPYSACHHDLLYIDGWLFLRHQDNGTNDQGVGNTGFNVWNADIANFSLVSEVGNITYCNLQYDKINKKLIWTVVDALDGLSGKTGEIRL